MKTQNKAFTLVELIIVITILAILATIGFMSYQSYTGDARDSSRTTTLRTIHNGLTISYVQKQKYPTPDNYLELVGVAKQGYVGETVSQAIKGTGFKDPKDGINYSYSLDHTGKKIQLSAFLERANTTKVISNNTPLNISYAGELDYSNRSTYTIGDMVCILLDPSTNLPVNYTKTGSLDIITSSSLYTAVCSNKTNSGTLSGTGQNLLTNISIVQNSCVLGNTVVTSGQQLTAYNTTTVAYNQACTPVIRSCNNGVLSGNTSYIYDTCSPAAALNCSATTYNGYTVPVINHNASQTITKNITGGIRDVSASCVNGVLSYGTENINCSTNYVLQGGLCVRDVCTGSAPDWTVVNGTQKYNVSWTHNTIAGQCTFVCQAGYYWNTTACARASAGYIVRTQGQTTQTACTNNNTYQNLTGQTSCKTVTVGYYSTPIGVGEKTGQTQCEANNYCVSGVKTSCPVGTLSSVGSTSSRACTTNTYSVSGSFGANANGATINVCGKTTTADTNGNFAVNANYGTVCNNAVATRTNYTCTTTTNGPASLTSNVANIAGSCVVNTQSATCGTIPANSIRNTATSITQTWNGGSWLPSTTAAYNTISSTADCRYTCATNYHTENSGVSCISNTQTIAITNGSCTQSWNGSSRGACTTGTCTNGVTWNSINGCSVTVNGTCGTSNGISTRTSPTINLCSAGTSTSVTSGTNTFTWSCNGSNGGTNSNCSANKQQSATCGTIPANSIRNTATSITQTWNGASWLPTTTAAYNTIASTANCRYTCASNYHTENSGVSCISNTQTIAITNGSCTQSWNGSSRGACTTGTCTNGVTWNSTYGCSVTVNGTCGTSNGSCSVGSLSWLNNTSACGTSATWNCLGSNGGSNASCSYTNSACAPTYTYSWASGTWGACNVSCGGGVQTRSVTCKRNDGITVTDSFCTTTKPIISQVCNTTACIIPINGAWSIRSNWSTCSRTCGTGIQTRTRTCTNPAPANGGSNCLGSNTETQNCNTQDCSGSYSYTLTTYGSIGISHSSCNNVVNGGIITSYGGGRCNGYYTVEAMCNNGYVNFVTSVLDDYCD